jgi:glycosyltransferase involved in cell wall biosynthesis
MLLPTKIFEYVASGRPILALAKNGLASDLIRESKSGVVLKNDDIPVIKDKLLEFIKDGSGAINGLKSDKLAIAGYGQDVASESLARVFNELIDKSLK